MNYIRATKEFEIPVCEKSKTFFNQELDFKNPTRYLGRNGTGKCIGISVYNTDDFVVIYPINSRKQDGRCLIAIDKSSLQELSNC